MKNKTMKKAVYVALLGCLASPVVGICATTEDMERRLQKLEEEIKATRAELQATKEDVKMAQVEAQDAAVNTDKGLKVNGYSTLEYVQTNAPGLYDGFRLRHMNLMFSKQVSPDLKFFSSVMLEDAPLLDKNTAANGTSGKLMVEAVNFSYRLNNSTTLRGGRFFTPAGIWSLDSIPFVLTQDRPLHIRNIFPQVIDGASVAGTHGVGSAFVGYDVFLGNGQTAQMNGGSDYNSNQAVGGRVNISLPFADRFELGSTLFRERMKVTTAAAEEVKNAYGVHFQVKQGAFYIRGEYAKGMYAPVTGIGNYNRVGYYIQPSYDINDFTVGYRYDFYNSKTTTLASSATVENVPFIAYHVDKNTTVKWEHHLVNLRNPVLQDFYRSIVSVAVNFD